MKKNFNDYFDDDKQPKQPVQPNQPNKPNQDYEEFQPAPQLYVNGELNPRYKTNRGSDLLYGLTQGAKMGLGQDPFVQLGLVIGGAIGGLTHKNSAGIPKYQQDVALNQQYNEGVAFRTNARMRLDQMEMERQKMAMTQQRMLQQQARDDERLKIYSDKEKRIATASDFKTKDKSLREAIDYAYSQGDEESLAKYQKMLANLNGIDPEDVGSDYGIKWGDPKANGNYYYQFSKGGHGLKYAVDPSSGEPISTFTREEFYKLASKEKTPPTQDEMDAIYDQSVKIVDNLGLKFTTAKGKIDTAQRNAYIRHIADQLLSGRNSQFKKTINIDGSEYSYEQLTKPQQKPQEKLQEKPQESQFMPQDNSQSIQGFRDVISSYTSATTENERRNARLAVQGQFNDITRLKEIGSINEKDYNLVKQMYDSFQESVNSNKKTNETSVNTKKYKIGDLKVFKGYIYEFNGTDWDRRNSTKRR